MSIITRKHMESILLNEIRTQLQVPAHQRYIRDNSGMFNGMTDLANEMSHELYGTVYDVCIYWFIDGASVMFYGTGVELFIEMNKEEVPKISGLITYSEHKIRQQIFLSDAKLMLESI